MESAFELEDISLNEISTKPQYIRSFGKYDGIFARCYNPTVGKLNQNVSIGYYILLFHMCRLEL